ncbi:Cyn operon transcriptional activator [Serratia quinivorans]|uniref:LysR family transcriptional regulator n=1 Tax=Serratia quinivorans TaxID=137545 RepID=A0ABV3UE99_9GAMM|nr:LysR family transcriptional regulator [Serratia quinivorans]CAI0788215.1 Cyn operon transcriptional activator [Serratia quinivorans]CAI1519223.1 Cyn operon transcriptional activator [Serratia quinivorans]CAI1586901.1 Cyn operon transcriptional activator [Serratia quinivorans]CAI1709386.1 Cyn operon transcriptional activator [Serratia quinivorans]CAI1813203.1 Cyn operon transcriptional activator [Serratia quinivorans]
MHNLLHWRLLVAVADSGKITQAASQCGMTQSAASQAIAQLEDALNTLLLVRLPHSVVLTQSGEQIVVHARTMLAELEAIQHYAQRAQSAHAGKIRLASFPSAFSLLLPPLLRKFRRRYPAIELVQLEGTDQEVENWLALETADVGVVLNPNRERQSYPLGQDLWLAVTASHHPLARGRQPVEFSTLAKQPFVLATGGCNLNAQLLAQQAGLVLTDVRITVSDWNTALTLVREDAGVSLIPASVIPTDLSGICALPLATPLYRHFGLACSFGSAASAPVQTLLQYLRQHLPVSS